MNQLIYNAIANKQVISFNYDGHSRIVEPHTYGISKTGKETLRGYQTGGTSDRGSIPDWRPFTISKIQNLQVTDKNFSNIRPGYTKSDSIMSKIFIEL